MDKWHHVLVHSTDERVTTTKLRRWRLAQGLTLRQVADLTGLSDSMISRVERLDRNASPQMRVRIARCLGVPIRDLFDPQEVAVPDDDGNWR